MKTAPKKTDSSGGRQDFQPDQRSRVVALLLGLVTVLIYLPSWFHGFIFFDDPAYVSDNGMVQNGLSGDGLKWAFCGWHASNWHPLTWLSHQLDCQIFGPTAGAHHLVNVLFHAGSTVLLFRLWLRLTSALWPSALVAALFAWHPLHVESVAWIAERKDVLSSFFGLLALLAYARFAANRLSASSRFWRQRDWLLALVFFALGLLAKPMLVTLPFVLLLLDYWPLRRMTAGTGLPAQFQRLAREKWPFFLLAAISSLITFLAQREHAVLSLRQYAFGFRLENAALSCAAYLLKTIWPSNLAVYYPLPSQFPLGMVALSATILIALSVLAWRARWRHGYFLMGWLWFLGMLVPVIGLVQVGEQAMADRYMYLPAIGLFVAVSFGLAETWTRSKWPASLIGGTAVLVLGLLVAVTERQLSFWTETETLFTRALAVTRNNGPAHMMLGAALEHQNHPEEALREYRAGLDCDDSLIVRVTGGEERPLAAQVQLLLGQAAEQRGDAHDAVARYREALRLDANIVEAHNNLGNLLEAGGSLHEALAHFQSAVRLRPDLPLVHESLGIELVKLGEFDEAMREYQEAARLAPGDPRPLYLRGKACLRRGQSQAAVAEFQNALGLDPTDYLSLTYLARTLAADENPRIRDGTRAVALAEKANTLTGSTQALVLGTLAMAYGEVGRFSDACKTARTALGFAAGDNKENISILQAQLRLYESNQPVRETFTGPTAP